MPLERKGDHPSILLEFVTRIMENFLEESKRRLQHWVHWATPVKSSNLLMLKKFCIRAF
jgi:hypothetical protein